MGTYRTKITKMLEGRKMKNLMIVSVTALLIFIGCSKDTGKVANDTGSGSTGEGGSMAAMTIIKNHLYRIAGGNSIEVYDISNDSTAKMVNNIGGNTGLETLFPFGKYLLVGTQSGMLIYDISNGANPTFVSRYDHVVSCDPVVAQGNYAYVTLRNGTRCWRGLNQLEIIDLSNISQPKLVRTMPMLMPHGLDADGINLVVGEGQKGFKWLDISDPTDPVLKHFETSVPGYDIISRGSYFILVGAKGLYQYSYGSSKPELLSFIPVVTK